MSTYLKDVARRHLRLGRLPCRHIFYTFLRLHPVVGCVLWSETRRCEKPFDLPSPPMFCRGRTLMLPGRETDKLGICVRLSASVSLPTTTRIDLSTSTLDIHTVTMLLCARACL